MEVWRHDTEDAVAGETEEGVVKSYRWTTVNGTYVMDKQELDSDEFSKENYHFVGWALPSKL